MLVPCPGFSLYQTIAEGLGSSVKHYPLLPEKRWQVDVDAFDALFDENTKAVLLNNPSNPCGSVFPREHLLEILAVCEKHRVPVIADEIYANLCFEGTTFHKLASLTRTVPVLSVSGIAKEFLVPGWRLGWITAHDNAQGSLKKGGIKAGLQKLTQVIIGACTLIQSALPDILSPPKGSLQAQTLAAFRKHVNETLTLHAKLTVEMVDAIDGLYAVVPEGAMYVMCGIEVDKFDDTVSNDVDFCQALLLQKSVFVLPGKCFGSPNFFRVVFCAPLDKLRDAFTRMADFCQEHRRTGGESTRPGQGDAKRRKLN